MDRISHLPEEIISKILSFLPTRNVMRTMFLSKSWKSLWILVPRLEFDDVTHCTSRPHHYGNFRRFVDRSLLSRAAAGQVLQSLSLKSHHNFTHDDVEIWLRTAVKLGLKELELVNFIDYRSLGLKSIYTCETLVVLRLENSALNVRDHLCLRSLKTLSLIYMSYSNPNSLLRMLPSCPVLEELFLQQRSFLANPPSYKIIVPSLRRLSLIFEGYRSKGDVNLVIDTPSLKSLQIVDRSGSFSFSEPMNINQASWEASAFSCFSRAYSFMFISFRGSNFVRLLISYYILSFSLCSKKKNIYILFQSWRHYIARLYSFYAGVLSWWLLLP